MIRSVRELDVWVNAMDLAMQIYHLSKEFPKDERYSLTDQIRRSSRSVAANIAEAWRKRRYPASFVSKLNDAEAEMEETCTWIELAVRCEYWGEREAKDLTERSETILRQLVTMINRKAQWCEGVAVHRQT